MSLYSCIHCIKSVPQEVGSFVKYNACGLSTVRQEYTYVNPSEHNVVNKGTHLFIECLINYDAECEFTHYKQLKPH